MIGDHPTKRTQRMRYLERLQEIEVEISKTRTSLAEGGDLLSIIKKLHGVAESLERVYGSMEDLSFRALKNVLEDEPRTDSIGREYPV